MAKFLTTTGTSYHIEDLIIKAQHKLVLVSPFLQLSKTLLERLADATKRGVKIKIIYGKDELKPNEKNSLAELNNLKLFYLENLHAKCYFSESEMVITSMNMYQFSEKNNREMGVYIDSKSDKELFDQAVKETSSIIEHSRVILLQKVERSNYQKKNESVTIVSDHYNVQQPKLGYCLRCEIRIPYDAHKPLCYDCYCTWAQFENMNFNENVCHCCGEFTNPISFGKPQCYDCSKKYPARKVASM
jgi:phosphatidylserine/phosphatidylglycerophosphate/cardiolipin synthase-like enzyme